MKRLAIICTHPIQYYAPIFRKLSREIDIKVFYSWGEKSVTKYDPGFKREIVWDIPLLDGYPYEFLENVSRDAGSHHFFGIRNPSGIDKINSFEPDVILIFGWSYFSHLQYIRYFSRKIPVWFRGDSNLLDNISGLRDIIKFFLLKWVFSHIDRAFYVGKSNREYFKKYGLSDSKLTFAPHAVENERFGSSKHFTNAEQIRADYKISQHEILILFAGKLEPKKDPLLLLAAFAALNAAGTHILFVGNGELENSLKEYKKNHPILEERIHFKDFQNQTRLPAYYHASDLFCLPSIGPGETWGLAVNEAMAAGKAILLSSKVGCGADLVCNGENGYIFDAGNLTDLKIKLQVLLDKAKLYEMGKKSKEKIRSWNFDVITHQIVREIC